MVKTPSRASLHWAPAFRIIATRFPAVDLWEGVDPALWERLDHLESMTNPRLTAASSEGSSYIQWPFANQRPGRFSTNTLGAFYAARDEQGAVAETVYHKTLQCEEDRLDPLDFDMRVLRVEVEGRFHDLRGKRADPFPGVMNPDTTRRAVSQAFALELHQQGSQGIVYSSVRDASGCPCVAAFDPATLKHCAHLRYLTYRWNGVKVEPLYEKKPLA